MIGEMTRKKYHVKNVSEDSIEVSRNTWHVPWNKANTLEDFVNPWSSERSPATKFRALWSLRNLYFKFDAEDSSIFVKEENNSFENIGVSDRVEIFFRKNKNLSPYYCMEIDSKARIMDFKAYPNRKFDFGWSYKKYLKVKSSITENGYSVEGAVSMKLLKSLNLIQNGVIETGLYRAKYIKQQGSDYKATWMSWVNPQTKLPDFHVSSSFGILNLEEREL